jgi:hypothetical protein
VTLANSAQVVQAWQQRKTTAGCRAKSPIDIALEAAQQAEKTGNSSKPKKPAKPAKGNHTA